MNSGASEDGKRGNLILLGPPGTGKTTRVQSLVEDAAGEVGRSAVLATSYTQAAARELASRGLGLDKENIGTLHSICYRQMGGGEVAESHIDEWNKVANYRYQLSGEVTEDDAITGQWASGPGDDAFAKLNLYRAQMTPEAQWDFGAVRELSRGWNEWKQTNGYIDFADMIDWGIANPPPQGVRVGFFDEAQDFSAQQIALVKAWAGVLDRTILAGDDDQALYAWAGGDARAFVLPDAEKSVLGQSYRVPKNVMSLLNWWLSRFERREPKPYQPRDYFGLVHTVTSANSEYVEPVADLVLDRWLGRDVQTTDRDGNIKTRKAKIMFLASCGYQLDALKSYLRQSGISYHNPYRKSRFDWNPLGAANGNAKSMTTAERIARFLRPDHDAWGTDARPWSPDDVRAFTPMLKKRGLFNTGGAKELEGIGGNEVTIEQFERVFTLQACEGIWSYDLSWLVGQMTSERAKAATYPLQMVTKRGRQSLLEAPSVIIGTIHSVKGAEADAVVVFPDLSRAGYGEWLAGGLRRDSIRRQFYVGFSRARSELYLTGTPLSRGAHWAVPFESIDIGWVNPRGRV